MATATDSFDRADAANRGANWTSVSGFNTRIDTNQSEGNNAGDPALEYYNPLTPSPEQYSQIVLKTNAGANPLETGTDGGCGPAVYIQSGADSCYMVRCNNVAAQRFQLIRRIAGAETVLVTDNSVAPVDGDVVRLEVALDGSSDPVLDVLKNGTSLGGSFPFTDTNAAALTSGNVGDFGTIVNEFIRWDDWEGGDTAVPITDGPALVSVRSSLRW